jgi:hypothetical protein
LVVPYTFPFGSKTRFPTGVAPSLPPVNSCKAVPFQHPPHGVAVQRSYRSRSHYTFPFRHRKCPRRGRPHPAKEGQEGTAPSLPAPKLCRTLKWLVSRVRAASTAAPTSATTKTCVTWVVRKADHILSTCCEPIGALRAAGVNFLRAAAHCNTIPALLGLLVLLPGSAIGSGWHGIHSVLDVSFLCRFARPCFDSF